MWHISKTRVAIYQNMRLEVLYLVVSVRGRGEVPVKREEVLKFSRPQTLSVVPVVDRRGVLTR